MRMLKKSWPSSGEDGPRSSRYTSRNGSIRGSRITQRFGDSPAVFVRIIDTVRTADGESTLARRR